MNPNYNWRNMFFNNMMNFNVNNSLMNPYNMTFQNYNNMGMNMMGNNFNNYMNMSRNIAMNNNFNNNCLNMSVDLMSNLNLNNDSIKMNIHLNAINIVQLQYSYSKRISDLISTIKESYNINQQFKLKYENKPLVNSMTLAESGLGDGANIYVDYINEENNNNIKLNKILGS